MWLQNFQNHTSFQATLTLCYGQGTAGEYRYLVVKVSSKANGENPHTWILNVRRKGKERKENYRHASSSPVRVTHTSPGETLEISEMVPYAPLCGQWLLEQPFENWVCHHIKYSTSLFTLHCFQKHHLLSLMLQGLCLVLHSSGTAVTEGNPTTVEFHIRRKSNVSGKCSPQFIR